MNAIFKQAVNDEICLRITGQLGQPEEGEVVISVTPQELIAEDAYGNRNETWMLAAAYWYQDGKCVPRPPADIQIILDYELRESTFINKLEEIDQRKREENLKLFPYSNSTNVVSQQTFDTNGDPILDGNGDPIYNDVEVPIIHNYVADTDSIRDVTIECANMNLTDVIPTPNGVWKTDDTSDEEGLVPIYVNYTVEEFLVFKSAYFQRSSDNFGVREYHQNEVKKIYADPEKTIEDIKNYDISTGWL